MPRKELRVLSSLNTVCKKLGTFFVAALRYLLDLACRFQAADGFFSLYNLTYNWAVLCPTPIHRIHLFSRQKPFIPTWQLELLGHIKWSQRGKKSVFIFMSWRWKKGMNMVIRYCTWSERRGWKPKLVYMCVMYLLFKEACKCGSKLINSLANNSTDVINFK